MIMTDLIIGLCASFAIGVLFGAVAVFHIDWERFNG